MTLEAEIHEQPVALARLLAEGGPEVTALASWVRGHEVRYVVIAARGTSDNAARYAKYLWGERNRLTVGLAAPSLFGPYGSPPSLEGSLVVGISQSGRSPDLVAVLEEARRQGRPAFAVTNDPASPLARAADAVLDLRAGPERAVAATKTYTAELLAIALFSAALAEDRRMLHELNRVPDLAEAMLARAHQVEDVAEAHREIDRCAVLGRGFNLATAFEWALKLQELCYVAALAFSSADFEHGPIALAEPGFSVFAVAPDGPLRASVQDLTARLRSRHGAPVLAMSDHPETLAAATFGIRLPGSMPEWESPIAAAVGVQLFCAALSRSKSLDPDTPRTLRKVTRTR
jgi:glutamine---fructose-6-phosphate transaminase (isomerizing)